MVQPAVARLIVEARTAGSPARGWGIYRAALRLNAVIGAALCVLVWVLRGPLAAAFRLPDWALAWASIVVGVAVVRPVIAGALQGGERFVSFGLVRVLFAFGRLLSAAVLLALGLGLWGGVVSLPIGAVAALIGGLAAVGARASRGVDPAPPDTLRRGVALSLYAFVAYGAWMLLLNADLFWVNRTFSALAAGAYAAAAVLRRAVILFPAAVVIIFYPRVVAAISRGQLPDRLVAAAGLAVLFSTMALALPAFPYGGLVLRLAFGARYALAGDYFGWMALGMVGYALAAIWLNLYLASRPGPYAVLLLATAGLQAGAYVVLGATPQAMVTIFGLTGVALAIGGLALYALWLRPALASAVPPARAEAGEAPQWLA